MKTPGINDALLPDVNECLDGTQLCAQTCVNTEGSYVCSCGTGYRLNDNGLNCSGTVEPTVISIALKGHCDHDSVNAILYRHERVSRGPSLVCSTLFQHSWLLYMSV